VPLRDQINSTRRYENTKSSELAFRTLLTYGGAEPLELSRR
jgi:hypothetical protein